HTRAPGLEQLAVRVVLEDWRFGPASAGILKASMDNIDAAVGRRLNRRHSRPFHSRRKFTPISGGAIRLGKIVSNSILLLRKRNAAQRGRGERHHQYRWSHRSLLSVGPTVRNILVHRFAASLQPAGPPTPVKADC